MKARETGLQRWARIAKEARAINDHITKRTAHMPSRKSTSIIEHGPVEIPPGPWKLHPHTPDRNLWTVHTSQGLAIGPIWGKEIATAIQATPELIEALNDLLDCVNTRRRSKARHKREQEIVDRAHELLGRVL